MYKLHAFPEFIEKLKSLGINYPSLLNKIQSLSENPNSVAINTEMELFCEYYVNAGRHAILFDMDEEIVYLKYVMLKARLHKILSGKIQAP